MNINLTAVTAGVLFALLNGGPAGGETLAVTTELDVRRSTVRFADLDLSRPAGAAVLYQRIEAAARRVCGNPYVPQLADFVEQRNCRRATIDDAVQRISSPLLIALHRTRTLRVAAE